MNLKKGDRVLCVENNSTVRPLVIESVGDKILFSKQLDKGVKRTFGLKEGTFKLIKPRYISEHEKEEYKNPDLEMNDRVKVIHVEGTDNTNLLGRDGIVISIKENERGDREIMLYMEDTQQMANLELEYKIPYTPNIIQKSLVLKLDEPKAKQEDYIDGLLHIPEQTEEKKQKISPDLEVGDRIMVWGITGDRELVKGEINYQANSIPEQSPLFLETPSTFIATVIEILEYDQAHQNGIKYIVKIQDTNEVVGLYGGEWAGGSIHPIRNMYQKDTRDKWLKLPKIDITEDIDVFGQGLLDPIEPEEFEGEEEEWDELVGNLEEPEVEPEYDYQGGQTDASVGFVAPSSDVTDNICKVKGFCEAQGPITFGQLKSLVEEATKKRIAADMGRGVFKTLWRLVPFFIPQILLAAVGVTATRAINKIITPALKDTKGYKSWWGKVVLKAMDIAEGDYIPDVALGDDPLSKIFFISDGLLEMIRDKYKLKFARYVADYASTRPDNEPVPEWFVENLLRDYLNQKFLLDPPMEPKEGTDFQIVKEHEEGVNPDTGLEASGKLQTTDPFNRVEIKILNYLTKEFTREELNTISSVDETQVINDLEDKWLSTMKLFGEVTEDEESWIRSTRWAKWAVENYSEACDGPDDVPCDFKDVTTPIKSWPSWFEVDGDQSYWQKEYRKGTLEIGAYDSEEAEERAEESWWSHDVDMDHYDYGDTDDEELEIGNVRYLRTLNEHKSNQEESVRGKVQHIVDSVYPHIVNNLGPSEYVNEPPTVELHKDIYERLSGVEGMRGEESESSEAQYERHTNTLYIYYPNMRNEKHVIQSLLHEYTHSLQNPKDSEGHRKDGYENDQYEKESLQAESNWEDYLIYLQENINEHKKTGLNPELKVDDIVRVIDVDGEHGRMPERFGVYRVVKVGNAYPLMAMRNRGHDTYYDIVPYPELESLEFSELDVKSLYRGDTWIYGDIPMANKVDRKTITEHKETKVNPELMVGDEIMVVSTEGIHDFGAPELYKPYVVVGIKHAQRQNWQGPETDTTYYQIEPIGMTDEERTGAMLAGGGRMRPLYIFPPEGQFPVSDQWILKKGFLRGEHLTEHVGESRNMKGFTPKLIGYLKFMFENADIQSLPQFEDSAKEYLDTSGGYSSVLYAILKYNQKEARKDSILHMLNVMPIGDYVIPKIWEYEVTHYGSEDSWDEYEACDSEGFGEMTGEPCDCINAQKMVKDGEYYTSEDCEDHEEDDECECEEWDTKHYELFSNEICTKIILSYVKLERTLKGSDGAYGYEDLYDLESELGDDYVEESIECDVDYDETSTWQYFDDKAGRIIGLDTDSWKPTDFDRMFTSINNNIYGVKPIEEQYDMVSTKDSKMKELTDQIFNILDENFGLFEHPEGEIEYDGKSMGLYSYENDNFVPFEHIYNPIMQMLEHGIQQEDVEVFVEIITNWVSKSMSTPEEKLNEEVNIKSDNSNYSKEDYENFVDFAHNELNIEKDCPIDVEAEKSSEYTTGNYNINDRKIKILDNGRKLADILRTIAHELVHHKQNELGMLVGDIPEIGGKIEDQANAYAGRLVKKYGKQTPSLYTESPIDIISEEKVVGFKTPNNNFVVIAGGPGAGKSFITKNLINLNNVKEFNVDQVRVMTAKKLWGDEWEEKISTEEGYDEILRRTFTTSDPRNLTVKFLKQFLQSERDQEVNVVYDAGGGQEQVMKDIHELAKENGFNTTLVYVRTPLDIAQERNIERPRSLPPEMVAQYHQQVKDNMRNMIPIFDNVWTVDNKELIDLSDRPSDNIEKLK